MTRTSSTSFSSKAPGHSGRQANAGVWAADGAASFGKREPVRYAAVRIGAGAAAPQAGRSRQVHALCPTFHSSGLPTAPAEFARWAPLWSWLALRPLHSAPRHPAMLAAWLMLAFGPLAARPSLASASRCGMLLFAWALARTRKRWVFAASSRASPNILFKRTRWRAPLNATLGRSFSVSLKIRGIVWRTLDCSWLCCWGDVQVRVSYKWKRTHTSSRRRARRSDSAHLSESKVRYMPKQMPSVRRMGRPSKQLRPTRRIPDSPRAQRSPLSSVVFPRRSEQLGRHSLLRLLPNNSVNWTSAPLRAAAAGYVQR